MNSDGWFHHVLVYMGHLHFVLSALKLSSGLAWMLMAFMGLGGVLGGWEAHEIFVSAPVLLGLIWSLDRSEVLGASII